MSSKTKQVRMLTALAGADYSYDHGQVVEVPATVAKAWIAAGTAEAVEAGAALEASRDALAKRVADLEAEVAEVKADNERLALELAAARNPAPDPKPAEPAPAA